MIYGRFELWPRGDKSRAIMLHEVVIYNDGSGDKNTGNYKAFFSRRGGFGAKSELSKAKLTSVLREVRFEGFKRLKENMWQLLFRLCPEDWKC